MNPKFLLFLLLPLFFAACDDDDDNQPNGDIMIRVTNITLCELEDIQLGFTNLSETRSYGSLAQGDTTGYLGFEAAGTCSIDFSANYCEIQNGLTYQAFCECICSLEPGNHLAQIIDTGGFGGPTVVIERE